MTYADYQKSRSDILVRYQAGQTRLRAELRESKLSIKETLAEAERAAARQLSEAEELASEQRVGLLNSYNAELAELDATYGAPRSEERASRADRQLREQIARFEKRKTALEDRLKLAKQGVAHVEHLIKTDQDSGDHFLYPSRLRREQEECQRIQTELNSLVDPRK